MAPDRLIHTGIDRLLDYLEGKDEVEVREAATALGADRETVITWANALEDAGLIDITFSARRGRVMRPVDEDVDEEAIEQAREETADRAEKAAAFADDESDLERFATELERLKELLDEVEDDAGAVTDRIDPSDRERLEAVLDDIDAAEADVAELRDELDEVLSGLRVLEQLAEEGPAEDDGGGLMTRLTGFIPFVGGSDDDEDGAEDEDGDGGDGNKTFKCEECGEEFEESWQKAQHVRREHSD